MLLEGALLVACFLCPFDPGIYANQTEVESSLISKRTLFIPVFSPFSLSGLSHTLLYNYMPHSNREQFSLQPVLRGARASQSHSFHSLIIHSSSRMQTHSHSTKWPFAHTTGTRYHITTLLYKSVVDRDVHVDDRYHHISRDKWSGGGKWSQSSGAVWKSRWTS